VTFHPKLRYVGTAWLLDKRLPNNNGIAVTNAHVAKQIFDAQTRQPLPGLDAAVISARLNFRSERRQANDPRYEFVVTAALWIGDETADVAFLEIAPGTSVLPLGIPLSDRNVAQNDEIAVIGYPAFDSRSYASAAELKQIFDDTYDVKRLQPGVTGEVTPKILHDCSTLGGNSGSVILDLMSDNCAAIGLHAGADVFNGKYWNYALPIPLIKSKLAQIVQ